MCQITHICVALLLSMHVAASFDDYSIRTWPYMALQISQLEMSREQIVYGDQVIPRKKGLIELECNVARSSLESSLDKRLRDDIDGIEWVLPNPKMITERRAFIKKLGSQTPKLHSFLVIKDFRPTEDAGAYSCRLKFKSQHITRYQKQIYIPSLDGAPILKCDLECKRNTDEACQLLENFELDCQAYSLPKTYIFCYFEECETEDKCPPFVPGEPYEKEPEDVFNRATHIYKLEKLDEDPNLAMQSGVYDCQATNNEGVAVLRLFMPVTVNASKHAGVFYNSSFPAQPRPEVVYGSREIKKTEWYGTDVVYDFGCWTSKETERIRWSFRPIGNREVSQTLAGNTLPWTDIEEYKVNGGQASVLKIHDAYVEHGGFYFCEAADRDNDTVVNWEFEVDSGAWADDANVHTESTITGQAGSSVTLNCTMRATGFHLVSWDRMNQETGDYEVINERGNYELSHYNEILTLHNLTEKDTGLYRCACFFSVNKLEAQVTLNVVDGPVDQHGQIESLHHAVNTLRAAENQIHRFVQIMRQHIAATRDNHSAEEGKD